MSDQDASFVQEAAAQLASHHQLALLDKQPKELQTSLPKPGSGHE